MVLLSEELPGGPPDLGHSGSAGVPSGTQGTHCWRGPWSLQQLCGKSCQLHDTRPWFRVVEGPGEGTSSYLPGSRHLLPGPAISLGILVGSTVHIQDRPLTTGVDKHCPSSEFPYFTLTPFLTAFISLTFPRALILGSHPDHTCMF